MDALMGGRGALMFVWDAFMGGWDAFIGGWDAFIGGWGGFIVPKMVPVAAKLSPGELNLPGMVPGP